MATVSSLMAEIVVARVRVTNTGKPVRNYACRSKGIYLYSEGQGHNTILKAVGTGFARELIGTTR